MKKVIIIAGAFAIILVGGIAGMLYWVHSELETERNRNKTAEARKARWSRREEDPDPATDPDDLDHLVTAQDPPSDPSLSQKIPAGGMN